MKHRKPFYLRIGEYIESLTLGQGRLAGQPFRLTPWQRRFLKGTFTQEDDAASEHCTGATGRRRLWRPWGALQSTSTARWLNLGRNPSLWRRASSRG